MIPADRRLHSTSRSSSTSASSPSARARPRARTTSSPAVRSGTWVFLLALFGTNMTAFAILGSSGLAYQRGIGVYGLMASASAFVIPLTIFFIGTRLWALGKKFGHMTQVQFFRDRWECCHIGTLIFALTAAMLVPYIIIGVMGGGQTLEALSTSWARTASPDVRGRARRPDRAGAPSLDQLRGRRRTRGAWW